jgi:hypothetical protein
MFGLAWAAERYGNDAIECVLIDIQWYGECVHFAPGVYVCLGGGW